jgi:hypothetical protein
VKLNRPGALVVGADGETLVSAEDVEQVVEIGDADADVPPQASERPVRRRARLRRTAMPRASLA